MFRHDSQFLREVSVVVLIVSLICSFLGFFLGPVAFAGQGVSDTIRLRAKDSIFVSESGKEVLVIVSQEDYFALRNLTTELSVEGQVTEGGSFFRQFSVQPGQTVRLETSDTLEVFAWSPTGDPMMMAYNFGGKSIAIAFFAAIGTTLFVMLCFWWLVWISNMKDELAERR